MMFSLEVFNRRYETEAVEIRIDDRLFRILLPKDLSAFINFQDVLDEFPLWAKVWKASWLLAGYLAARPPEEGKKYLEIGGGLGLVSIVAASCGHRITMTEYNPDALQFARANAHINGCGDLSITAFDWNQPKFKGKFDCIVASEVIYKEDSFARLLQVFSSCLKTDGEIILASEVRKTTEKFCHYVQPYFNIQAQKKTLRSEDENTVIILLRLTPK